MEPADLLMVGPCATIIVDTAAVSGFVYSIRVEDTGESVGGSPDRRGGFCITGRAGGRDSGVRDFLLFPGWCVFCFFLCPINLRDEKIPEKHI